MWKGVFEVRKQQVYKNKISNAGTQIIEGREEKYKGFGIGSCILN